MIAHQYRLSYFNVRSRVEGIRWILKVAKVPFKDDPIDPKDWLQRKPSETRVII